MLSPLHTGCWAAMVAALLLPAAATAQSLNVSGTPDANGAYFPDGTYEGAVRYVRAPGNDRWLIRCEFNEPVVGYYCSGLTEWMILSAPPGMGTFAHLLYRRYDASTTVPLGAFQRAIGGAAERALVGAQSHNLELVSFTAVSDRQSAHLSWKTLSETNTLGFTVERRLSDGGWADASPRIDGAGTTTERRDYRTTVPSLDPGAYDFRIRQDRLDGSAWYSSALSVQVLPDKPLDVTVRGAQVRIAVQEPEVLRVDAYTVLGQHVGTLHDGSVSGVEDVAMPSDLATGLYLVRVMGRGRAETVRVLVH